MNELYRVLLQSFSTKIPIVFVAGIQSPLDIGFSLGTRIVQNYYRYYANVFCSQDVLRLMIEKIKRNGT